MKKVITMMLLSLVVVALAGSSAQAILVSSSVSGTLLNDHFEDGTVGTQPDDPPWNSWKDGTSNAADIVAVTDAGAPGANSGSKYLELFRSDNPNGRASVHGEFNDQSFLGGTLSFQFALYMSALTEETEPSNNIIAPDIGSMSLGFEGDGDVTYWDHNDVKQTFSTLTTTVDQWMNISGSWTIGTTNFSLTVDGVTEAATCFAYPYPGTQGATPISHWHVRAATSGSRSYVDGWVPEPATLAVLALGGIAALLRRRHH